MSLCFKSSRIALLFSLLFYGQVASAQIPDSVASAIQTLLLQKEISEKIFFYYDKEWNGSYHLGSGTYAFICPDTTFQRVYKGIIGEFPHTMRTDGLLYKRNFYKDSVRAIYINGIMAFELYIVFTDISVTSDSASISFFTTSSRELDRFMDRYVNIKGRLVKKQGQWSVVDFDIKPSKWRKYQ